MVQSLGGERGGTVMVALRLDWLNAHLATLRHPNPGTIVVADRDGRELGRMPPDPARIGRQLAPEMASLGSAPAAGSLQRTENSRRVAIGYVPATVPPIGLLVIVAALPADLIPGLGRAAAQGYAVIAAGFLLATALALLAGHRYLRQPTAALLRAARAWKQGDLAARARLHDPSGTEFGMLATAFNSMAEALEGQRAELRALNGALETRVAERTRALLESNNRLQVVIAERERTEESLRQVQKLQAVGQLAGGIAHDFNNLLTAISGSLEILQRSVGPSDARGQRLIAAAATAAARGGRLTGQLLAFSRKQKLVPAPTDINGVVMEMSALLASTLGPAIRVETRLDTDAWPAMTDPNQLEAAILNLAINARDAMPAGGRLVIATANASVQDAAAEPGVAPGEYVALTVSDSGTGMTSQVLARAFEPFFTTKAVGQGSGLGLSQVHGLAQQSGGTVRIASRPGAGTSVSVLLPARAPAGRDDARDRALAGRSRPAWRHPAGGRRPGSARGDGRTPAGGRACRPRRGERCGGARDPGRRGCCHRPGHRRLRHAGNERHRARPCGAGEAPRTAHPHGDGICGARAGRPGAARRHHSQALSPVRPARAGEPAAWRARDGGGGVGRPDGYPACARQSAVRIIAISSGARKGFCSR